MELVDNLNSDHLSQIDDFITNTVVRVYSTQPSKSDKLREAVEKFIQKDTSNALTQDSV